MSRLPGIGAALAATVRRVNAAYAALPKSQRPEINGPRRLALEAEVDRACADGDADAALAAIAAYGHHALRVIEEATP